MNNGRRGMGRAYDMELSAEVDRRTGPRKSVGLRGDTAEGETRLRAVCDERDHSMGHTEGNPSAALQDWMSAFLERDHGWGQQRVAARLGNQRTQAVGNYGGMPLSVAGMRPSKTGMNILIENIQETK